MPLLDIKYYTWERIMSFFLLRKDLEISIIEWRQSPSGISSTRTHYELYIYWCLAQVVTRPVTQPAWLVFRLSVIFSRVSWPIDQNILSSHIQVFQCHVSFAESLILDHYCTVRIRSQVELLPQLSVRSNCNL